MRRALLGAGVLVAALVAAASSLQASTTLTPQRCTVVIYLDVPVRSPDIEAVKARLRRDRQVVAFRFITRAEALEQLRKQHPAIVANLKSNPLPARLHVQLKVGVDDDRFVTRYRALRLGGVDYVRSIEPSRASCVLA